MFRTMLELNTVICLTAPTLNETSRKFFLHALLYVFPGYKNKKSWYFFFNFSISLVQGIWGPVWNWESCQEDKLHSYVRYCFTMLSSSAGYNEPPLTSSGSSQKINIYINKRTPTVSPSRATLSEGKQKQQREANHIHAALWVAMQPSVGSNRWVLWIELMPLWP